MRLTAATGKTPVVTSSSARAAVVRFLCANPLQQRCRTLLLLCRRRMLLVSALRTRNGSTPLCAHNNGKLSPLYWANMQGRVRTQRLRAVSGRAAKSHF